MHSATFSQAVLFIFVNYIIICIICTISTGLRTCIAAHILVNVSSIFAVEPGLGGRVVMALVQSVVAVVCGMWILRRGRAEELERK